MSGLNWAKLRYGLSKMPWVAFLLGFILYFTDSLAQGFIPHINAGFHEIGHYLMGKMLGLPVPTVQIGSAGDLLLPPFKIGATTFSIHRFTEHSWTDAGAISPSVLFVVGGPAISIIWGVFCAKLAKKASAMPNRYAVGLTIILGMCAIDSFLGRGVLNLIPGSPNSDGYKIFASLLG